MTTKFNTNSGSAVGVAVKKQSDIYLVCGCVFESPAHYETSAIEIGERNASR
jgi:hypothetical protein